MEHRDNLAQNVPCHEPPEIFGAFVAEFSRARSDGLVETIAESEKARRKFSCRIDTGKRLWELDALVSEAQAIEREITDLVFFDGATLQNRPAVKWTVKNGRMEENSFFQRLFRLYDLRYGEAEWARMREIFRNPENDGKAFLYVEFAPGQNEGENSIKDLLLLMEPKGDAIENDNDRNDQSEPSGLLDPLEKTDVPETEKNF